MAAQYMLHEIGLLLLVAGVGENYTLVTEERGCSLTKADRESCNECCTKKQKEDPSLKY